MDIVQQRGPRERALHMQKLAARIILEAQPSCRTVILLNNISWIPFYNEAYIKRRELAYKRISGTLPDYSNATRRKNSDAQSRTTRNCNLNLCPIHKKHLGGWTYLCRKDGKGLKQFTSITKTNKSLKSFKAELLNSQKTKGSFDINQ